MKIVCISRSDSVRRHSDSHVVVLLTMSVVRRDLTGRTIVSYARIYSVVCYLYSWPVRYVLNPAY